MAINPPETSAIHTDNAINFFSDSAGTSVNSEDLVGTSINNDDFEDNLEDSNDNLEEVPINNDNLEDISSNEEDVAENDNDISSEDDVSENDDVQNNDYNQKMANRSELFQPFDGEYGPYFANFTEQMFFLWVTKHMICK